MKKIFKLIVGGLPIVFAQPVLSQKLPNVQAISLHSPSSIKIDGNLNEWGSNLQAYNKATQIFYSMANDNDNLYLAIRITDKAAISKAVLGGITLIINSSPKSETGSTIEITFPKYDMVMQPKNFSFNYKVSKTGDSLLKKSEVDSVKRAYTAKVASKAKAIGVVGVDNISDGAISIYNDLNIKAAFSFDNELAYNYELALPLKYLRFIKNKQDIFYKIQLNGLRVDGTSIRTVPGRDDHFIFSNPDGSLYTLGGGLDVLDLMSASNFTGVYVLVNDTERK